MRTPFANDPFAILDSVFKELYPDKAYRAYWEPEMEADGEPVYGMTVFDKEDPEKIGICISGRLTIEQAIEVYAHELAHVAAGVGTEHGEEWEKAFEEIFQAYDKRCTETFSRR